MTMKERLLFGTIFGAVVATAVAGPILMREYDKVQTDRAELYTQLAYLINVMQEQGLEIDVVGNLITLRNFNLRSSDET